ncbi:MAG: 50S ribosomal protein L18 [candidate division WOR-3 bacterium]
MIKDRLKRRHYRIRKKIAGTDKKPRLCIKRSNKHIYAILVNDIANRVITTVSSISKEFKAMSEKLENKQKTSIAERVGLLLAEKAKALGINEVVFDRGGYRYHGRVKALAEGARKGGLKF